MTTPLFDNHVILFTERQSFLRHWWWIVLLLIGFNAGILLPLLTQAHMAPWLAMSIVLLLGVLPVGLLALFRIDTRLDAAGVSFRMFPLGWEHVSWNEVTHAYVRQYSALGEYGGWGVKGFSTKNYAYNAAGNQGIQLELTDKRRILVGTQRPIDAQLALTQLGYTTAPTPA
ncbi:MAG: hypothetical protein H7Z21_12410 [Hymenobacter sp.]|nr:hypothetical protein [Hymenobacter sp.]